MNGEMVEWSTSQYEADTEYERSTMLKKMVTDQGPRLYYVSKNKLDEQEDKIAWLQGRALHSLVLEGRQDWFVFKGKVRRGKAFEDALLDNPGLYCFLQREADEVLAWRDAMMRNKDVREMLESGLFFEKTFLWEDDATGIKCKCRVDLYRDDGVICDIKTAADVSPDGFFWNQQRKFKYEFSAAYYEMGRNEACGRDLSLPMLTVIVGKKKPHWCYLRPLCHYQREIGQRDVRRALDRLHKCRQDEARIVSEGGSAIDAWPDDFESEHLNFVTPDRALAADGYGYQ